MPYTPHAGAYELHNLFKVVQPKRVHPLVRQSFIDDQMCVIPSQLLNDGCEIVGFELDESIELKDRSERMELSNALASGNEGSDDSFLELSQVLSGEISDLSSEISGPILDVDPLSSESLAR